MTQQRSRNQKRMTKLNRRDAKKRRDGKKMDGKKMEIANLRFQISKGCHWLPEAQELRAMGL
jgi:hypothetical protein